MKIIFINNLLIKTVTSILIKLIKNIKIKLKKKLLQTPLNNKLIDIMCSYNNTCMVKLFDLTFELTLVEASF